MDACILRAHQLTMSDDFDVQICGINNNDVIYNIKNVKICKVTHYISVSHAHTYITGYVIWEKTLDDP